MRGLKAGRPLAWKIRSTAAGSVASAQAVNGFGRERDQASARQHTGRVRQGTRGRLLGINLEHSRFHQAAVTSQSTFFRAEGSGGFSPRAWKSALSCS